MPAKPTWLKRIPQIRASLEASTAAPFLDRAAIEKLFSLRRRQALRLLHKLSSHLVGNALVAPRERVLLFLKATQRDKPYVAEELRRQRVREALQEARLDLSARSVRFPLPAAGLGRTLADLPPTMLLAPGQLSVSFKDPQDLLQQLFTLSKAIAKDFQAFERAVNRTGT